MTSDTAKGPDSPTDFDTALAELEGLIGRLESGELPLEQLLTQYEHGAHLLAFCRTRLEAVETQIKVLEGGQLKPWVQD